MQISSKDKTILVFSDPHQEIDKVKRILKKESYDQVVCLGDWFDSFFYEDPIYANKTARFLSELVFQENFLTLFGNHDLNYLFKNQYALCGGYTTPKREAVLEGLGSLFTKVRDKFRWYVWIDDFLCTHAGVHTYHFPPQLKLDKKGISEWLDNTGEHAIVSLINNNSHWFFRAGEARGGSQRVGGIVWLDFDAEFEPIEGLKQLVGHSYHRTILNHVSDGNLDLTKCDNLDIDCNVNQYLLIRNGEVKIKRLCDLD